MILITSSSMASGVDRVGIISSKQLLALPVELRVEYLQRLAEILATMDESSNSVATKFFWRDFLTLNRAYAESGEIVDVPDYVKEAEQKYYQDIRFSTKIRDETVTPGTFEAADIAMKKFEDSAKEKEFLIEPDTVQAKAAMMILIGEIQTNLDKGDKAGAERAKKKLDSIFLTLKLNYFLKMTPEPRHFMESLHSISGRIKAVNDNDRDEPVASGSSASGRSAAASSSSKPNQKNIPVGMAPSKVSTPIQGVASNGGAVPSPASFQFELCLYAGFALKDSGCEPPHELPADFAKIKEFAHDKFKCKAPEVICNPLLFGFNGDCPGDRLTQGCASKVRPVCAKSSASVTALCVRKTKDHKFFMRAQSLIGQYPSIWESFRENLNTLCDEKSIEKNGSVYFNAKGLPRKNPDYIKNDILKTCKVAVPKMKSLNEWYENVWPKRTQEFPISEGAAGSSK